MVFLSVAFSGGLDVSSSYFIYHFWPKLGTFKMNSSTERCSSQLIEKSERVSFRKLKGASTLPVIEESYILT